MEKQPLAKRRRVVTSCSECYRRKQKCDRQKPCNICLARHVEEKCCYGEAQTLQHAEESKVQIDSRSEDILCLLDQSADDARSVIPEIQEQFGYSSIDESNASVGLKELLNEEAHFRALTTVSGQSNARAAEALWTLAAQLPPVARIQDLTDTFFSKVNWQYSILDRYYFNELLVRWLDTTKNGPSRPSLASLSQDMRYFPALLFQVCALALQFIPADETSSSDRNETAEMLHRQSTRYSDAGVKLMWVLGRHDTTMVGVQQDLLRAAWLKNCARVTEAWHSLGHAIRQAQHLSLHRQSELRQVAGRSMEEKLSILWYDEYKKRLWINLFIWDSQTGMLLGRPRTINVCDCDVKAPTDCDIPSQPTKTPPIATGSNEKPSAFSERLFQYNLSLKLHEIRALGADRPTPKNYAVVSTLHDQLITMLDAVPLYLQPQNPDTSWDSRCPHLPFQREYVLTSVNSTLMALHRSHVSTHPESREAAVQAAIVTLASQKRMFELSGPSNHKLFILSFCTVDAAILLTALTVAYPPKEPVLIEQIAFTLREALSRLMILQKSSPIARSGVVVLKSCYQRLQDRLSMFVTAAARDKTAAAIITADHDQTSGIADSYLVSTVDGGIPITSANASGVDLLTSVNFEAAFATGLDDTACATSDWSYTGDFDPSYWCQYANRTTNDITEAPDFDMTWDSLLNAENQFSTQ